MREHRCVPSTVRVDPVIRLVAAVVVVVGCAALAARTASALAPACSLVTAAKVRSVLGYPVRLRAGETASDCVLLAIPVRLDPDTLSPLHPTIDVSAFPESSRPRTFARELKDARRRGHGPVPGLGSQSFLMPGPRPGEVGIYARIGTTILDVSVGPARTPIAPARAIALARLIAARL